MRTMTTATTKQLLTDSVNHWRKLADEQDRAAAYADERGWFSGTYRNRSKTYRDTARAIELELETGKSHCNMCIGANREAQAAHPNHECPWRPGGPNGPKPNRW